MMYNPKNKTLSIPTEKASLAYGYLRWAIRHIRECGKRPLEGYKIEGQILDCDYAEEGILRAAEELGIDMGATRAGVLDVRDAP